jgi:hypothetical protein
MPHVVILHMILPFVYQNRRCRKANSAAVSDTACNGSSLHTSIDHICDIRFLHITFRFLYKIFLRQFHLRYMHIDSNSIKYMYNSSFKHIGGFTYPAFTETCCPGLPLICQCLKLSCGCRVLNPCTMFFQRYLSVNL